MDSVRQTKTEFVVRHVLSQTVERKLFPRCFLTSNVQEVANPDGNAAPAINATCLSLLDGAVPMRFMFCGVYVTVSDPSTSPAAKSGFKPKPSCSFVFVFKNSLFTGGDLIGSTNTGKFTMSQYEAALEKAKQNCLQYFDYYREVLGRNINAKLCYTVKDQEMS
ncbi:hypothetical protein L596_002110 [Steinernema carpocapsae]|uniref:Uncharacterized protein n=1 Tax=Steinernema carpocapsae TaxID=34508 RepID=A0A4U8UP99_STECR|nr:hypothetical protein L596_002110 [Steinernema carpocapsae]